MTTSKIFITISLLYIKEQMLKDESVTLVTIKLLNSFKNERQQYINWVTTNSKD